jgi:hypothetical protein
MRATRPVAGYRSALERCQLINSVTNNPGSAAETICGPFNMIAQDAPVPPKGFLTLAEEETLIRLRQERQDAAREERELLLAARARKTTDDQLLKDIGLNLPEREGWEGLFEGLSPREREGFWLLQKHEFERWGGFRDAGSRPYSHNTN